MNEQHLKALKCMVFAQSFVEALDDFGGTSAFKHQLKNKGNSFAKEVDKFLNDTFALMQSYATLKTLDDNSNIFDLHLASSDVSNPEFESACISRSLSRTKEVFDKNRNFEKIFQLLKVSAS